ncbi:glutamate--tRNA ligase [Hwanghaeella grinnelliae]|uniref:Glutamate--tRNA ligase n=1 Tax=Hwanghaeella grinnelliae TaxID=2500179 RepID=A0A3S2VTA1_9PROT|nr:glutamate--tRNA ligase [Hwanghaeella grinnelliae]RVU39333.1 glutamate--tRNA ligase [Hwanghaeella grinnelliae]
MTVVTRFAPSPTGFLHIGGARTALFNWLYARHHGGKYLLRIEDTDRARSTQDAIEAILDGLNWLGLMPDGDVVFQSKNADRHAAVAKELLAEGKAYLCYCSQEELAAMREKAKAEGRPMRYDGTWRDRDPSEAPAGVDPVVRLKMPQTGETTIADEVQGDVTIGNAQLDDMILLRSDGTPTYMLSVVVDDHDMGVTHVIRGDDHLTNAFRQYQLFVACGWDVPTFAHIPLIHGPDGAKLSKRHGALGVDAYRDMGYLPEAINNYLLRLGWAHGDEEIISQDQAVEWFDLPAVGKSAARFDFAKLENLNGHYIRQADDARLAALAAKEIGDVDDAGVSLLTAGMPGLKERAKTVAQLAESAKFYLSRPTFPLEIPKAAKLLAGDAPKLLGDAAEFLESYEDWAEESLQEALRGWAEERELGLGKIAQPLRAALTGSNISPSIFEIMVVLGKEESLARIRAAAAQS